MSNAVVGGAGGKRKAKDELLNSGGKSRPNVDLQARVWESLSELCTEMISLDANPVRFETKNSGGTIDISGSMMESRDYDWFDLDTSGNIVLQPKIPIFPEDFPPGKKEWPLSWWGIVDPVLGERKDRKVVYSSGITGDAPPPPKEAEKSRDKHQSSRSYEHPDRVRRDSRARGDARDPYEQGPSHPGSWGPSYDQKGPYRDDRGPPPNYRGPPPQGFRGPSPDDRGPPRDDRGRTPLDDRRRYPDDRVSQRHPHDRGHQRLPDDRGPQRHPDSRGHLRHPDDRGPQRYLDDRGPQRHPDDRGHQRHPDDRGHQRYPDDRGPNGPPRHSDDRPYHDDRGPRYPDDRRPRHFDERAREDRGRDDRRPRRSDDRRSRREDRDF